MSLPPPLVIAKDHFFTFEEGITKEWLLTNGRGGYACSTVIGANSRRYHGLLIASFPPHLRRLLIFSKVEEVASYGGQEFYLGVNRYPNTIHPQGHRHLIHFRQDPFPVFTYQLKDALLEKEIFLVSGQNAVVVFYRLLQGRGQVSLRLYPFLQCRSHHHLRREDPHYSHYLRPLTICHCEPAPVRFGPGEQSDEAISKTGIASPSARNDTNFGSGFIWSPPDLPEPFAIHAAGADFRVAPDWYYNLQYDRERERGQDFEEDGFCPGFFEGIVGINFPLTLWASCPPPEEDYSTSQIENLYRKTKARKLEYLEKIPQKKPTASPSPRPSDTPLPQGEGMGVRVNRLMYTAEKHLLLAAESFKGQDQQGNPLVMAGYPWFGHWGRDALISLPGLFLVKQHFQEAKALLLFLARHCRKGLIPRNFSEEEGQPDYASVDTSLWFIYALHQYIIKTKDAETLHTLLPVIQDILGSYQEGTSFGIKMNMDNLIEANCQGLSLTWMDTPMAGAYGHTPQLRSGKTVEVNALWYNALCSYHELLPAGREKDRGLKRRIHTLTQKVQESFNRLFWDPRLGYLYDLIGPQGPDGSLRPNQLFAISLPFPVLEEHKWKSVFDQCWRELFTPWGLRSLAPSDPRYRGRYLGDPLQREEAYHQGTVWAWLLGPFFTAFFKIHGRTPHSLKQAQELLEPILLHLKYAGLGFISEIFDGDPPHRPKGCIAQAWSVAEILRVLKEEIKNEEG